ncbi:MAG: sulfotransferase, partial [Anaerolineales bacterium]
LQEIWARPHWPNARFYEPHSAGEAASAPTAQVKDGRLVVEASADLPNLKAPGPEVEAVLNVGGAALPPVTVLVKDNFMSEQELRAALTTASGYELCRVCVREALLGQPLNGSASLRERLAYAARQRPAQTLDHKG